MSVRGRNVSAPRRPLKTLKNFFLFKKNHKKFPKGISSSTCSAPSFTPFQYHNTIAQRIAKRSKSLVKLFNSLKCQRKSSNNEKNFLNKLEKRKSLQINEEKNKIEENKFLEKNLLIKNKLNKNSSNNTKEIHWQQQLYQSRLKLKMSSTKL
ncbi:hypothetical protein ACQ4LE_008328 [Meloidogyne hapla]